jgi:putative hemin transport protein
MDPRFNLHLQMDSVAKAWLVRKPTDDGIVTSVELFDGNGEAIAMFFGERKPGKPELTAWRSLVSELLARSATIEA